MLWADEVEGATQRKVNTNAMEASVKTNAGQAGAVGPPDEMQKMWAELASQRRQLTEGLAEQGKILSEVLLMASTTGMLPPFGQQPVPRRRLEDIVYYGCHQKGHIRRNCPAATVTLNQWPPLLRSNLG